MISNIAGMTTKFRSRRGMASALIIMLLVLLVFFGVLSLVTSAADLRLSRKRAEWNLAFYQADAAAVELLAALHRQTGQLDSDNSKEQLERWLAGQSDLHDWLVEPSGENDGIYYLSGLVASNVNQGQGIEIRLTIRTGPSVAGDRIIIEKWSQWQPPFEYGGAGGGIWQG